jgi:hypothetical protein
MTLGPTPLTAFQHCPRRWKLEQTEPRGRWQPKALLDHVLRRAIFELSNGGDKEATTTEATTRFMEFAADPGLDMVGKPYDLACDLRACLRNLLEALARLVLLVVKPGPTVCLSPDDGGLLWRCGSFQDEAGQLHSWRTVSHLDSDRLARELHAWHVFGDVAAADVPMTLHIIEIGSLRHGRQHSPWCKAYRHPAITGRFAFQKRDGSPLGAGWQGVWFQDLETDPKTWNDMMARDGISLIHHIDVRQIPNEARAQFIRDVGIEAGRMAAIKDWRDEPIRRTSCDTPFACPWQNRCFSIGRAA